jgi:hypothetical protein
MCNHFWALQAPRADHLTLMERRRLDALNHALSQARTEQAPPTASNGADSAPVVLSDAPPTIVRLLVECMVLVFSRQCLSQNVCFVLLVNLTYHLTLTS